MQTIYEMPELPEITVISRQMNKTIIGKTVAQAESKQPKNLNMPINQFYEAVEGKAIVNVSNRGKWIFVKLECLYYLLMSLGMGGDLLYFRSKDELPEKYHFKLIFTDGTGFTARFSWFGYIHLIREADLPKHKMTAQLGISPMDNQFTEEYLSTLLHNKKMAIKSFLMDQKNIAGIGNVYIQDILFRARLHPNRKIFSLSKEETGELYRAIKTTMNHSIELGGLTYEKDFHGTRRGFTSEDFLVGYKEGKPCPTCGTTIEKIRTGTTATYICPNCQKIQAQ